MNSDICMGCFEPLNGFDVCSHCGWHRDAVPEHAYHLHQGTILQGRYIVGNTVGMGGFGITYKAWDANLNSLVAIKEFYPAGLVSRVPGEKELVVFSGDKKEQFDASIKRFLDEAKTMAKFTDHPNIVHVFDFFEENHTAYIVMEFLDGITVKQLVESLPDGKLPVETAKEIVIHVLEALSEMHSKKIIHRDISPDNIQITGKNEVKIFDFGAAKLTKEDSTVETKAVVVKTGYTPPEQYRANSKQGIYTDLYSVGAVLYKLITGTTPEESIDRIVEDNLQKPSKLGVEIDSNLEKVIMKALALKQELRFQNALQFKDAILDKKNVDFPEVELKKRRRFRVLITALLSVFTIAFFTVFGLYITSEGEDPLICENGKITVCLPVSDKTDIAETQKDAYQDIVDKFIETAKEPTQSNPEGNSFEVELVTVEESIYYTYLMDQIKSGKAPDVFNTDQFGDNLADYTKNLELLTESLTSEDCIIIEEYKESYPNSCEFPTGFYSGAIYVNQSAARNSGVIIPETVDNLSEFFDSAEKKDEMYTVAISGDNVDDTISAMISGELYDISHKKFNPDAEKAFNVVGNSMVKQGLDYENTDILNVFKDNNLVYCIDDTNALATYREHLPGYYKVLPLTAGEDLVVTMTKHMGVYENTDENTAKIAMQFIRFMLTDYAQDLMHIQNNIAVPVNKNTLTSYLSYNNDIKFISNYIDKFKINGEERHICYDFNVKLYNEIMLKNKDYGEIRKYLDPKTWK